MNPKNKTTMSLDLFYEMKQLSDFIKTFKPHLQLVGSFIDHLETFKVYESYPIEQQKKIFSDFIDYSNLLTNAVKNAEQTQNNQNLIWGVLKTLRLSFDSELFNNLTDDDVVEIYRNDNIQVFRNLNFHNICSFRYPELFIYQWPTLFQRDDHVTQQIMAAAIKAFSGEVNGFLDTTSIGTHDTKEVNSPEQLQMIMHLKSLYPLKDSSGEVPYILAISNVKLKEARIKIDYSNVYTI